MVTELDRSGGIVVQIAGGPPPSDGDAGQLNASITSIEVETSQGRFTIPKTGGTVTVPSVETARFFIAFKNEYGGTLYSQVIAKIGNFKIGGSGIATTTAYGTDNHYVDAQIAQHGATMVLYLYGDTKPFNPM